MSEPLYVGIDIGKLKHVACLLSTPLLTRHKLYEKCPTLSFANSRHGFEQLFSLINKHSTPETCHVLLEETGHYGRALEQFLQEKGVQVYQVHVQGGNHKNKSDKRDAQGLAVLLYNQIEQSVLIADKSQIAHRLIPASDTARLLHGLVQHRSELKRETTRRKNKLTAHTDELFPEFTQIYIDPNSPSALQLRAKFPTPQSIADASLDDLADTRKRNIPNRSKLADLQSLARHTIGTKDTSRLTSMLIEQAQLIKELNLLLEHVDQLNAAIKKVVKASREGRILLSFGIIGHNQAATIIASIGSIANFPSAAKLRSYCGWSPHQSQTGTSKDSMTLSQAGNRLLKPTLCLIAWNAVKHDTPWKAIYDRLVPLKCHWDERTKKYRGKMKVIGRICGQLIGVIFTLLKKDHDLLAALPHGQEPPDPILYDASKHSIKRHP